MSERKTAEFKLRCTPEEKIRWQREAEDQNLSLSELVRQTMNDMLGEEDQSDRFKGYNYLLPPGESNAAPALWKPWMFEAKTDA